MTTEIEKIARAIQAKGRATTIQAVIDMSDLVARALIGLDSKNTCEECAVEDICTCGPGDCEGCSCDDETLAEVTDVMEDIDEVLAEITEEKCGISV